MQRSSAVDYRFADVLSCRQACVVIISCHLPTVSWMVMPVDRCSSQTALARPDVEWALMGKETSAIQSPWGWHASNLSIWPISISALAQSVQTLSMVQPAWMLAQRTRDLVISLLDNFQPTNQKSVSHKQLCIGLLQDSLAVISLWNYFKHKEPTLGEADFEDILENIHRRTSKRIQNKVHCSGPWQLLNNDGWLAVFVTCPHLAKI